MNFAAACHRARRRLSVEGVGVVLSASLAELTDGALAGVP